MKDELAHKIRAKQVGVLLRDARKSAGLSMKQVSQLIGVGSGTISAYERGDKSPSLPQLEALAYIYRLPLEHFVEGKQVLARDEQDKDVPFPMLIAIRDRLIGAILRKKRVEQGLTLKEVAERIGVSSKTLSAYELGDQAIPYPVLEELCEVLNLPLRDLHVKDGVIGEWFTDQQLVNTVLDLPPELKSFLAKPVNQPYLELAMRLSEMSVDKLRAVAEGLLEITL